jgi:hypothetical protein
LRIFYAEVSDLAAEARVPADGGALEPGRILVPVEQDKAERILERHTAVFVCRGASHRDVPGR